MGVVMIEMVRRAVDRVRYGKQISKGATNQVAEFKPTACRAFDGRESFKVYLPKPVCKKGFAYFSDIGTELEFGKRIDMRIALVSYTPVERGDRCHCTAAIKIEGQRWRRGTLTFGLA